jgi:hypothetical protein
MKRWTYMVMVIGMGAGFLSGANAATGVTAATGVAGSDPSKPAEGQGYRIDQPGTITFTVGVKIKGKVEKPQVMIMLPKEKSVYREIEFSRSFRDDLMEPLPFIPVTE